MYATETSTSSVRLPLVDLNSDRREERRLIYRRSRRHAAVILVILGTACAVLAPLSLQILMLRQKLHKTEGEAKQAHARLNSMTTTSGELDGRIGVWQQLVKTQQARRSWGNLFPALAACVPSDVVLLQVQVNQKDGDTEIQIQGSAGSMAELRTLTAALAQSSLFAQIHLDEAVADHTPGHNDLNFRLTGPITIGPGTASP